MCKKVVLAVDIGGSKYVTGLITRTGEILYKKRYIWTDFSRETVIERLIQAIRETLQSSHDVDVAGIGMAIPGLADPGKGIWISSGFMGIRQLPIKTIIEEQFHLPVYIENDCNACALAEMKFGGCADVSDFLYLTVSNSIGGALVLNRKLYRGAHGRAGEIGMFSAEGLSGIDAAAFLEDEASGRGLSRRYEEQSGRSLKTDPRPDGEIISERSSLGEPAAIKVLESEGKLLGRAVADACWLLDPEKVIIGGGVSLIFDHFRKSMREVLQERRLDMEGFSIEPTSLGYDGALLGAACLALWPKDEGVEYDE